MRDEASNNEQGSTRTRAFSQEIHKDFNNNDKQRETLFNVQLAPLLNNTTAMQGTQLKISEGSSSSTKSQDIFTANLNAEISNASMIWQRKNDETQANSLNMSKESNSVAQTIAESKDNTHNCTAHSDCTHISMERPESKNETHAITFDADHLESSASKNRNVGKDEASSLYFTTELGKFAKVLQSVQDDHEEVFTTATTTSLNTESTISLRLKRVPSEI